MLHRLIAQDRANISSARDAERYWQANATAEAESLRASDEEARRDRARIFQEGVMSDNVAYRYWMANSSEEAQLLRRADSEASSADASMRFWKANSTAESELVREARRNASSDDAALQQAEVEVEIARQARSNEAEEVRQARLNASQAIALLKLSRQSQQSPVIVPSVVPIVSPTYTPEHGNNDDDNEGRQPLRSPPAAEDQQLRRELHHDRRKLSHVQWIIASSVACLLLVFVVWRRRKGGRSYLDAPLLEEPLLFPGKGLFTNSGSWGSDKHGSVEHVLSRGSTGMVLRGEAPKPVHVKSANLGSWADSSGLCADDEIVAVNDILVTDVDSEDFDNEMQKRPLKLCVRHQQGLPERAPKRSESFKGAGRFEPSCSVFDYTRQPGQVLRCLHVEAPGRSAAPEGQRSLRSEVTVESAGACATDVHMRLIKVSDLPAGATAVEPHGISDSANGTAASGTWEKTFRFDGIWQLLQGDDQELDAHGILQVHLVRMSPPPPVVLKTGREPQAHLHCSIASSLMPSPAPSPQMSPRQGGSTMCPSFSMVEDVGEGTNEGADAPVARREDGRV